MRTPRDNAPATRAELVRWLRAAPRGTTIPVESLAPLLNGAADPPPAAPAAPSWRERLWSCPPDTRLGVHELAEAVGRPRSWVHRHSGPAARHRLPTRLLDGALVFVAGEVRQWLRAREEIQA